MSRRRLRASPSSPPPETRRDCLCALRLRQGLSTQQQQALAVGFPASSPYVTAVGGTQMAPGTFAAGASSYWAPPLTTTLDATQSLLSYVPEVVWNEDSSARGLLASGGGVSSIFARPSWQTGVPGIPSGSFRLVPDIAMQASIASPGYLVCSEDSSLSGATSDCQDGLVNSNNTYALNGGTSFGAPILAGFLAILNQYEHTTGLGNINPVLYNLAAQPSSYASVFHDITSGTSACLVRRRQLRRARPEQLRLHHRIRSRNRPRQHRLRKARGCMALHSVEPHSHKRPFHPRLVRHPHRRGRSDHHLRRKHL